MTLEWVPPLSLPRVVGHAHAQAQARGHSLVHSQVMGRERFHLSWLYISLCTHS